MDLQESPVAAGRRGSRRAAPTPVNVTVNSSVRTLILGIDSSGQIVQHDRTAPKILAGPSGDLLGVQLADITAAGPVNGKRENDAVTTLLEAVKAEREGNAVLTIALANGGTAEAIVTAKPMQTGGGNVAAFVILQIPVPSAERFVDPALMRDMLMRDTVSGIEDTLDFSDLAEKLMARLVPAFCTAGDLLVLESLVGDDEMPTHGPDGNVPLRRLSVLHDQNNPAWQAAFPIGEILRYPPGSPYVRCIESGKPVLEHAFSADAARKLARAWRRKPVSNLMSDVSMLMLPLVAKGTTLGFFCCIRQAGTRRFDAYDMEMGMEFASRAAVFFDNARRYNREHATALTLQRSMLPTGLSAPSSVEVKHRYLPGCKLVEVGGDWYESIRLPGARVALVVGDVAGHGVRAAVTGECELAVAGHLPPLVVHPDGRSELLEVAPSPPLGVGNGGVETQRFTVEDGSLFVLYTDGLVESRDRDITDGLDRLQNAFGPGSPEADLEELCKTSLDGVYSDAQRDDIAVLIAKLRRIPEDQRACWSLEPEFTAVRQARSLIRDPLKRWGLEDLVPVTELLVSELVTNAIKYAKGEIRLRLVLESDSLVCEVHDSSPALPRVLQVDRDAENGRGLHVVSQLAARWGARRTHAGKVVWCEQTVPASVMEALAAAADSVAPPEAVAVPG